MTRRAAVLATLAALAALAVVQTPAASATGADCANPRPGIASSARTCPTGDAATYQSLQQRLGGDLAKALATQHRLTQALNNASATEVALSAQLALEESRVADLQAKVDALDREISDLESRITTERTQIAALARAMYERPTNLLEIIASSGNLAEMLSQTSDLVVAGQRAHVLQERLQSDLTQVQSDRDARQSDLDAETATLQQVESGVRQMSGIQTNLDSLSAQVGVLLAQIRAAAARLPNLPADLTAQLAQLLEQQQVNLAQQVQAAAWAQANMGAGLAADQHLLPTGTGPAGAGISMTWPMSGGVITQPFGPTTFALEPPLGQYAHFHTGIDVAAPLGTTVNAAAGGLVVVVARTGVGYGNYVIIAHGGGVLTLYGHLLEADAYPGEIVTQGEPIGKEGSSGFSTGPHLHFEVRIGGQVVDPMRFLPPA